MSRNKSRVGAKKTTSSPVPQHVIQGDNKGGMPLAFVVPTEFVDLPSGGKFYPEGHPLHDKDCIELKQMTAREEDILTSRTLLKKGVALDRVIENIIVDKSKKIIFYCKITGYTLGCTTYSSYEEIAIDAHDIKKYGDIPTCRRALKLLKKDLNVDCPDPIMTYRTQQRIDRKKRLTEGSMAKMSIHKGDFLVKFG